MKKLDSLGDRMKGNYESRTRSYLVRRTPVIMRLDGKAFHTLTRGCHKPFDIGLNTSMSDTAVEVFSQIQGAKLAYVQSDEISILITDFDTLTTEAWFDYGVQKMCSVAASIAGAHFTTLFSKEKQPNLNGGGNSYIAANDMRYGYFDCRVFNLPKEEVQNYFLWRFNDWVRNSVQMVAQAHFSHKQLHGKSQVDMHDMLHKKDINWAKLENRWKNGTFIYRREEGEKSVIVKDYTIDLKKMKDFTEQFLIEGEE